MTQYILNSDNFELEQLCKNYEFKTTEEKEIKKSLEFFSKDLYKNFFSKNKNMDFSEVTMTGVNLGNYTGDVFKKNHY